eukprot:10729598-Prorocentrum_lima.AAC.1
MAGQSDPHSPFGHWLAPGRPAGLMPMGFLRVPPRGPLLPRADGLERPNPSPLHPGVLRRR